MIDNPKFVDMLRQIKNEQRTGRMRVSTRVEGELSYATLFFNDGQLSNCEYNGKSGDLSISKLINSEIVTVVFVAGDGSDYIKDSSIRDIDTLLSSSGHQISDKTQPFFKPVEFENIAIDALKIICGDNATKLVNDLATRYPPEKNQDKFIEECVKLASNFVGNDMANKILKPLLATQK